MLFCFCLSLLGAHSLDVAIEKASAGSGKLADKVSELIGLERIEISSKDETQKFFDNLILRDLVESLVGRSIVAPQLIDDAAVSEAVMIKEPSSRRITIAFVLP